MQKNIEKLCIENAPGNPFNLLMFIMIFLFYKFQIFLLDITSFRFFFMAKGYIFI